jgi:IrrE N-terminal-like domain
VPLRPVEYLPDEVIAERVAQLIHGYERRRGRPVVSLPVPVESIIERVLGLRILWVEIEEQPGEIILARIDPNLEGQPTVEMNERRRPHFEQYLGTEPYSMAHEAGHWVLHYDGGDTSQLRLRLDDGPPSAPLLCRKMGDRDRREYQAERFAAHLLMPGYLMRNVVVGRDLSRWENIREFAHECGVSKTAMAKRLVDMRLIKIGPDNQLWAAGAVVGARRMF